MTEEKKHILITNDDGVDAPSLLALAQALRPIAKVTVFAPNHNWSGAGHVKTLSRSLWVREVRLADGTSAFTTDGAPSDCVALAKLGIITESIDLVVSGINRGANLGDDMTYSGTVTAAMEAVINGWGAIAFSMEVSAPNIHLDFDLAAGYAQKVVERVLIEGLPTGTYLNVNIPCLPEKTVKGFQVTRLGKRIYRDKLLHYEDPHGKPFYWIGGEVPTGIPEEGTDIGALANDYISITPLQLDLTAHELISTIRGWSF
ncbi:MAG: 5'/3'-nucleotidase SurE [Anaerolineaceae bacterium]|nr:5'/3'-nucleotidase SurE [Anaerolineaceae bacterium]